MSPSTTPTTMHFPDGKIHLPLVSGVSCVSRVCHQILHQPNTTMMVCELAESVAGSCFSLSGFNNIPTIVFKEVRENMVKPLQQRLLTVRALLRLVVDALTAVRASKRGIRNHHSVVLTFHCAYWTVLHLSLQAAFPGVFLADHKYFTSFEVLSGATNSIKKVMDKVLSATEKLQLQSANAVIPSSILYKIHVIMHRENISWNELLLPSEPEKNQNPWWFVDLSTLADLLLQHVKSFGKQVIAAFAFKNWSRLCWASSTQPKQLGDLLLFKWMSSINPKIRSLAPRLQFVSEWRKVLPVCSPLLEANLRFHSTIARLQTNRLAERRTRRTTVARTRTLVRHWGTRTRERICWTRNLQLAVRCFCEK